LFETLLKIQGKFRTPEIAEQLLSRTGTRQLLDRHIKRCPHELSKADATELLTRHPRWLVLDQNKQLLAAQDLAAHLAQQTNIEQVNLLEIAGRRLDMIPLPPDSTLFDALQIMNAAQVEAGYVANTQDHIIGIITRDKINNYYKL
jgi:predicted transcriptional regulator